MQGLRLMEAGGVLAKYVEDRRGSVTQQARPHASPQQVVGEKCGLVSNQTRSPRTGDYRVIRPADDLAKKN
jgi:hypothetical protein